MCLADSVSVAYSGATVEGSASDLRSRGRKFVDRGYVTTIGQVIHTLGSLSPNSIIVLVPVNGRTLPG